MDTLLLVRCLNWKEDGELHQADRDLIVSCLQSSDVEAGVELSRLLSLRDLPLPCCG